MSENAILAHKRFARTAGTELRFWLGSFTFYSGCRNRVEVSAPFFLMFLFFLVALFQRMRYANAEAWFTLGEISISISTITSARHTHARKWFGSWMIDSARAYAWHL